MEKGRVLERVKELSKNKLNETRGKKKNSRFPKPIDYLEDLRKELGPGFEKAL